MPKRKNNIENKRDVYVHQNDEDIIIAAYTLLLFKNPYAINVNKLSLQEVRDAFEKNLISLQLLSKCKPNDKNERTYAGHKRAYDETNIILSRSDVDITSLGISADVLALWHNERVQYEKNLASTSQTKKHKYKRS